MVYWNKSGVRNRLSSNAVSQLETQSLLKLESLKFCSLRIRITHTISSGTAISKTFCIDYVPLSRLDLTVEYKLPTRYQSLALVDGVRLKFNH